MLRQIFKLSPSSKTIDYFGSTSVGITFSKNIKVNICTSGLPNLKSSQFITYKRCFSSSTPQNVMHKVLFVNAASPDITIPDPIAPQSVVDAIDRESSNFSDNVYSGVEYIPPPPVPPEVSDGVSTEVLNSLGEPTLASLGLASYYPPGLIQNFLETIHVTIGLPWWAAIGVATIIIRICVFPLTVKSFRNMAMMQEIMPQIQVINEKISEARRRGDSYDAERRSMELGQLMKDKNYNPMRSIMVPLLQAPIFISMFMGLRACANLPVESFKTGGIYWFTDLTVADPYFILPVASSLTMLAMILYGQEMGMGASGSATQSPVMKYVLRALPLVTLPVASNLPTAVVFYWVTTNAFSVIQGVALQQPKVRAYLKLAKPAPLSSITKPKPSKGFVNSVKDQWANSQITGELAERAQLDQIRFKKAGIGPLVKTYKTDPTLENKRKIINVNAVEKGKKRW